MALQQWLYTRLLANYVIHWKQIYNKITIIEVTKQTDQKETMSTAEILMSYSKITIRNMNTKKNNLV